MIERRSAEQFLAELEDIVRRFHKSDPATGREGLALDEALQRLRKLGFTVGQGLELLRRRGSDRGR
jgi:hypothetical protein